MIISQPPDVLVAGTNITLSSLGGTITIIGGGGDTGGGAGTNTIGMSNIGNTSGTTTPITGTGLQFVLAGGNNVTLSQSVNGSSATVTISAANSVQPVAVSGSNASFAFSTLSLGNSNGLLFYTTNGSIVGSYTVPAAQTSLGIYNSSQTSGQSSSSTYDARSLSIVYSGNISGGWTNGSLLMNVTTAAQSAQTIGIYGSSQTVGQSSSSTVDARSFTHVGQGIVSVGMSAGSLLISATTAAQTAQTVGIYASSQTVGQSSSSTLDARSFTHVGQGIVSIGMSGGSLLISATTAQSVQTQNSVLINGSSGSIVFTAGNNITLSQNASTITISGPNTSPQSAQTIGVYASSQTVGQSSSSTLDARSFTYVGQGIVSMGMSGGSLLISATTAQSAQTIGVYASSQTVGQSSSSSVDARSFTHVGQGIVSVGMSAGSLLISATTAAQSNQTVGLYALDNTTGQSSSSTLDARTLSFDGLGIASVGFSAGKIIVSVPTGGGAGDGYNIVSMLTATSGGGTAGATFSTLSGSLGLMAGSNITLSQTSNTINIVGPAAGAVAITKSWFNNAAVGPGTSNLAALATSNGTLWVFPLNPIEDNWNGAMTVNTLMFNMSGNQTAITATTAAKTLSLYFGLYTSNNSTQLGLLNSVSFSFGTGAADSNQSASIMGPRFFTAHSSLWSAQPVLADGSRYYGAFMVKTAGEAPVISVLGMYFNRTEQRSGTLGISTATNTTMGWDVRQGVLSASTAALPANIANSDVKHNISNANFIPNIIFNNINSSF